MNYKIFGARTLAGLTIASLVVGGLLLTSKSLLAEAAPATATATAGFDKTQTKAIEDIVRKFMLKHPEILLDVQAALEKKMAIARSAQLQRSLKANATSLFKVADAPFIGNPKGDITVVEFFDYNCGYCKRALGSIAKLVEGDKNVKVVFKELPIFGKESEDAARVALAARMQGKYWEIHKGLLSSQGRANEARALRLAKKHGLDMKRLKADMKSPAVTKAIEDVKSLAENMGINGTPHFFVGDKVIPGAPDDLLAQLKKRVEQVRKEGCAIC